MKSNQTRTKLILSTIVEKVQLILGIVIVLFFGLMTVAGLTDEELSADKAFIVVMIVMDLMGVLLIVLSAVRHQLIKNFKKYVALLSNDPTGSISNLASALGTEEETVIKNLDKMIKKKYFANAYIDRDQNCLCFPNREQAPLTDMAPHQGDRNEPQSAPAAAQMTTVVCKGCGGVNAVQKGCVVECEYCGSSIQG